MFRTRLESLLGYTKSMNQTFCDQLISFDRYESGKVCELFAHILTTHHLWNCRILGKTPQFGVWEKLPIQTWTPINQDNLQISTTIIDENELDEVVLYVNSKGIPFKNSIEDILFHVVNHSTHHRAQISLLLRGKGIEPIPSDYIFQIRKLLT